MTHPSLQASFGGCVDSWRAKSGDISSYNNNPADGAVLVDTGQLVEGWYDFDVCLSCDVNHDRFSIEHRNAANTADTEVHLAMLCAHIPFHLPWKNQYYANNERLRVQLVNAVVGNVAASISWVRRADP